MTTNNVKMKTLVERMNLKNLTPDVDYAGKEVVIPDINRPALPLTGFFENFDSRRVQIIGYAEYSYLETWMMKEKAKYIRDFLQMRCLALYSAVL